MTNEELYRQYLSGDAEAFEQLYLQMQGFIASVAKDAAQSCGIQKEKGQRKNPLAPMVYSRGYEVFISGICLKKLRSEQHETNLPFLKICASCEAGAGRRHSNRHRRSSRPIPSFPILQSPDEPWQLRFKFQSVPVRRVLRRARCTARRIVRCKPRCALRCASVQ